ncbi:DsbA family protein [Paeniglutamicibacter cryotolerans]|uniref:Protein-disulfide isomerase n=1 Tax=Paeniglutamicibacter cryotolerans TaxID=670079 RepID=A0A839QLB9_9MICC|nr:thioredoxin domain-containing protein [Paeniglutamicibacter cryotolerans]MBB2995385.1 protein-disulfide isomerase [Paeniglutamicibacter cryotolerans]
MASNSPRPNKAERNSNAREQAAKIREQQESAGKRKSLFIKLGVVLAVVLVVVLIAAIIMQNNRGAVADTGNAPRGGNAGGGITLISDTAVADTSGITVDVNSLPPVPVSDPANPVTPKPRDVVTAPKGQPINILLYVDANCVHCADFEGQYADQFATWLGAGDVTVEYRNVSYLNSGTNFSSRAANALACVANSAAPSYLPFSKALFAHYPEGEMSNKQLAAMAKDNGADVGSCISDGTFRPFVKFTDQAARVDGIAGTPSIFIQGKEWTPPAGQGFEAFGPAVQAAIDANKK